MKILGIDPGTTHSGAVWMTDEVVTNGGVFENNEMLTLVRHVDDDYYVVIEMIASMGMAVGRETFETVVWIGRFIEASGGLAKRLYRRDIKLHFCGSCRAKDANIWQAILDRYGPGKAKAVGTKKNPGPLHRITSHQRAALAVGLTWLDGVRSQGI